MSESWVVAVRGRTTYYPTAFNEGAIARRLVLSHTEATDIASKLNRAYGTSEWAARPVDNRHGPDVRRARPGTS